jgi:hypothetical protein
MESAKASLDLIINTGTVWFLSSPYWLSQTLRNPVSSGQISLIDLALTFFCLPLWNDVLVNLS